MKKMVLTMAGGAALAALLWTTGSQANGTVDPPIAGKPCPDFVLEEIRHYSRTRASLADFRGRWLILDFWTTGCSTCVASFPKINRLQKAFKDRIQFVLVGRSDDGPNRNIRSIYERFREKQRLDLASAYDGPLFQRWQIEAVPHLVIVDPRSAVYAVTDGRDMDETRLEALLAGRAPQFYTHKDISYDPAKLLLVGDNGGTAADLLYGSLLASWRGGEQYVLQSIDDGLRDSGTRFQVTGLILDWLYNYAYFGQSDWNQGDPLYGKVAGSPVREVADDTPFKFDFSRMENLYSYSANLAPGQASVEQVQRMLRNDLEGYFGYTAAVEQRQMPYWKLTAVATAREKLKARGKGKSTFSSAGCTLINEPVSRLLREIWSYHQNEPPFIDESGITGNVDLKLDAILTSLDDIRKALQANGLDLVLASRQMKVVVVRDESRPSAGTAAGT